jgi:hypothetical protein
MEHPTSLFIGNTTEHFGLDGPFLRWISRTTVHCARQCPASPFAAHRIRRLGTLCSMGVVGSGQDPGSEYSVRSDADMANSLDHFDLVCDQGVQLSQSGLLL